MSAPGIASAGCFDCHGTTGCVTPGKPQGTCADCHLGAGDVNDYQMNFTAARIDNNEWQSNGHGQPGIALDCAYCHDYDTRHGEPDNPFRLRNATAAGPLGQNSTCWACHDADSPGVDPDGAGASFALVNSVLKKKSHHAGYEHDEPQDGGAFCWDCHDPHGDNNIFMIHDDVAERTDGQYGIPVATQGVTFLDNQRPSDYVHNIAPPYDGVCQVCHHHTKHCQSPCFSGHDQGPVCTDCHAHDGSTRNDGWRPSCSACHGYPPEVNTPQGVDGLVVSPAPTGSTTAGAHALHVTDYKIDCYKCHADGMPITPVNDDYRIQMGFNILGFSGAGSVYNAQTLNTSYSVHGTNGTTISTAGPATTCENIYCHSDGTGVATSVFDPAAFPGPHQSSPAWDGSTSCSSCHSYPPAYAPDEPKANKHGLHASFGYTCNICHYGTTQNGSTITDRSKHVNRQYDVVPDPTATVYVVGSLPSNVNFTYTYDPGGGTCSGITCHANMGTSADRPWGFNAISANVSWSPGSLCASVNFAINVISSNGVPPYYYSIDWESDGSWDYEGQLGSHTHVYPAMSTNYTVTWTVRDAKMHTLSAGTKTTPVSSSAGAANAAPVPNVNRTGIVYTPVYGNPANPAQKTAYTVTITDLSIDSDFDACGHSGSGFARINWRDGVTDSELPLNLSGSPSGQTFSHTYTTAGTRYVQYYVRDNGGSSYITLSPNIQVVVPSFN